MSGQELAQKLRDLGFQVKSHMSALDDFQVLEIRGRLEAYGIVGAKSPETKAASSGNSLLRRKKKKKKADDADATEAQVATAPEPETPPADVVEPVAEAVDAPDEEAVGAPPEVVDDAAAPAEDATETVVAEADVVEAQPVAEEVASDPEPAVAEPVAEAPADAPVDVEPSAPAADEAQPETTPDAPTEDGGGDAAAKDTGEAKPSGEGKDKDLVRPSAKRRAGKVVGFIDPAQFAQSTQKRKSDSRRLRSRDDVMPDVRPTFGRDPGSGLRGGDGQRGNMTAQELRDRESSRFLRRRRPQTTGGGRKRGGGGRRDREVASSSPYQGSSVAIDAPVTIKKLANTLAVSQSQVLNVAIRQIGFGVNINSGLDEDTAILLASEFDVELEVKQEIAAEEQLLARLEEKRDSVDDEELIQRPPTVAFLGHVDHGKTTLIDAVRSSRLAAGESGGITQHIGAYQVQTKLGHTVTILDTPGHAAFTQMRARGASAVDVVVLVVAADDGVKPQTEEALNHAKAAGTPIVVAMNKMDKVEANPERVMNELAALGLTPEEWGGDTAMLKVSALKGDGVDDLLERVFLESEVLELKSHEEGPASGVILEAEIQQGKGKVAHLLVQDGSLKRGDVILAGMGYGKVRAIHDDRGKRIDSAGPSMPVEVTGLNELPTVGDKFHVVPTLDEAQEVAEERSRTIRMASQIERRTVGAHNLLEAVADADRTKINLIVKADVQGSVEVLKQQLEDLSHDEVEVKLVHSGVGQVLESDVDLAITSEARILAFHTSAAAKIRQKAEREGVELRNYEVIYELLDDVKRLMEGELAPEISEEITGHAEIRRIFKSSKIGNIAGCMVLDGKIGRNQKVRLLRDGNVVHSGSIGTLRREADDAKEVREGFECGIVLKDYNNIQLGDIIETYKLVETKRTL